MADIQTTAGAVAGASVSLTTIVLGAQVDALAIGMFAAFFTSIWLSRIDSFYKSAAAVLFSAMLAAYASPHLAAYVVSKFPEVVTDGGNSVRLLMALLVGAASPHLIPLAMRRAQDKIKGGAG